MKTIFYIASSVNGCIADKDGNTNWSAEDNASFNSMCEKIGAVVMGRNTFNEYLTLSDDDWPNKSGQTVILTLQKTLPNSKFEVYPATSPSQAINIFEKLKKSELLVIGGNETWTSFMKAGLVDEIFLDIEPVAMGNGKALFQGANFETKLKLVETRQLGPQTIQLHYQVIK
jgi:dihydrofolate reductase